MSDERFSLELGNFINTYIAEIESAKKLEENEARFRSMFENHGAVMLLVNPETGCIVNSNDAASKFYGYDKITLTSMSIDLINLTPKEEISKNMKEAHIKNLNYFVFPHKLASGEIRTVEVHSSPIEYKVKITLFSIIHDITEREKMTELLNDSEIKYRDLADNGQVLVWAADTNKKCNYFNRTWLEFTGRTLEQELGNGWIEGVHPDDLDKCFNTYVSAFDKHESFDMDYRLKNKDGTFHWIQDVGTPRFNSKNIFIGYLGQCLDINLRKENEEKTIMFSELINMGNNGKTRAEMNAYCQSKGYLKK